MFIPRCQFIMIIVCVKMTIIIINEQNRRPVAQLKSHDVFQKTDLTTSVGPKQIVYRPSDIPKIDLFLLQWCNKEI